MQERKSLLSGRFTSTSNPATGSWYRAPSLVQRDRIEPEWKQQGSPVSNAHPQRTRLPRMLQTFLLLQMTQAFRLRGLRVWCKRPGRSFAVDIASASTVELFTNPPEGSSPENSSPKVDLGADENTAGPDDVSMASVMKFPRTADWMPDDAEEWRQTWVILFDRF
ncbi:hypothetical protein Z517_08525 [Fonsecaea pedrosoi CBS 271.37]|uniref:Uncharacterized protein n=1 Tax=Fonsecaea pedrosoi CBS 271.37 TaxID=1442368 RepID=A0A0D2EWW9_9EURO|nr:uncharacterized protein Z517_08525 [Fonsecaea pedrosoi CBS 271.37]KIW78687.1 hypothetical protein Z517_08525 [Fonsecaea pedrosoi CBS 271.37]